MDFRRDYNEGVSHDLYRRGYGELHAWIRGDPLYVIQEKPGGFKKLVAYQNDLAGKGRGIVRIKKLKREAGHAGTNLRISRKRNPSPGGFFGAATLIFTPAFHKMNPSDGRINVNPHVDRRPKRKSKATLADGVTITFPPGR